MKYLLMIYGDEKVWEARTEPEVRETHERHARFMAMLRERGALLPGGQELARSSTATTVRNEGDLSTTDGPYAETAEQIGGFYLIDVPDLDAALEIARQLPEPIVEVRPVVMHPEMGN